MQIAMDLIEGRRNVFILKLTPMRLRENDKISAVMTNRAFAEGHLGYCPADPGGPPLPLVSWPIFSSARRFSS
jgi:hypothetical protein